VNQTGRVYLYRGSATGLNATAVVRTGPDGAGSLFGSTVASAGDIDGDGYSDLVVSGGTKVWLYLGGPGGLATNPVSTVNGTGGRAVGDVNGDGYGDLLVRNDTTRQVSIYPGTPAGLGTTSIATVSHPDSGALYFGAVSAGDINGDGRPDLALESYGTALVYLGTSSGFGTPRTLSYPDSPIALSAVDINGDGYADLAVGAVGSMQGPDGLTGHVYLYLGGAGGLVTDPVTLVSTDSNASFEYGESVAAAGDVNGDGYDDLVVGDPAAAYPFDPLQAYPSGAAYVYLGSAGSPSAPITVYPTAFNSAWWDTEFGGAVAGPGDVNRDGYADVMVGAARNDCCPQDVGAAYLFKGRSGGPLRDASQGFNGVDGDSGDFGLALSSSE
jgi:hypothetical protein